MKLPAADEIASGPTIPDHLAAACASFEERWQRGERPSIEEFLQGSREGQRSVLLTLLIRIDVRERARRGETPGPDDYVTRFPQDRETILGIDWTTLPESKQRPPNEVASTIIVGTAKRSRLGRFELVERLGIGGFGEVWRAFDTKLQREVALKIGHYAADDTQLNLLLHEARSAGRLRHPGIVPVHDSGVEGGVAYIVSEYIPGTTLAEKVKSGPQGFEESARLVAQLAEATAHAHDRGIIHRDIKPANVLIDPTTAPHLTDFGVARRAAGDATISKDGQALGTPAYMAPEQAKGDTTAVDPRSDVYSLGLLLYEMLAGQRAYPGDAREALQRVLLGPPIELRLLRNDVPRDLETIVATATAREKSDRYVTARALAEDLERYLRGEPIAARRLGVVERGWRVVKKRPGAVAAVVGALALMLAVPGVAARWNDPPSPDGGGSREEERESSLPGIVPARENEEDRLVEIRSNPVAQRLWMFRRDPITGWVLPETLADLDPNEPFIRVPGGTWLLIVGDLGGGQFAEVHRRVPRTGEIPHELDCLGWSEGEVDIEGVQEKTVLLQFEIPAAPPLARFALVPEGDFEIGAPGEQRTRVRVPPFYLATHELTYGDFQVIQTAHKERAGESEPIPVPGTPVVLAPRDHAVPLRPVDADAVTARWGCRLPDEIEWEYAALKGADDWEAIAAGAAPDGVGPVGVPAADQAQTHPPIQGLRSNVAEATSSWLAPFPWNVTEKDEIAAAFVPPRPRKGSPEEIEEEVHYSSFDSVLRPVVVRGGSAGTWNSPGLIDPEDRDVRRRVPVSFNAQYIGLGCRAARSVKPRREATDFIRVVEEAKHSP